MNKKFVAIISVSALTGATLLSASGPAWATDPSCAAFDSAAQSTPTGVMTCVVPAGITELHVSATGAGGAFGYGGSSRASNGGNGAIVATSLTVTPGETLSLEIGQGGVAASNLLDKRGGGGGGWTAIFRNTTPLVVAGGGGGGGSIITGSSLRFAGGDGGTPTGGDGSPASYGAPAFCSGFGGTVSAGGASCTGADRAGGAGSSYMGGYGNDGTGNGERSSGANRWQPGTYGGYGGVGGSGGAGYFGGSGGGSSDTQGGGSGGGGSSYVATGSATYNTASNGGQRENASMTAAGDGVLTLQSVPLAPTISSISAGNSSATVAFSAPSSDGGASITNYEYSIDGGSTWVALSPPSTTSPFTMSSLTNGTQYSVTLRAVNSHGGGVSSAAVTVTPQAPSLDPIDPGTNPNIPVDGIPLGAHVFLVDGVLGTVTVTPDAPSGATALDVVGDGFTMVLRGLGANGQPLGLTPDGALILEGDRMAHVEGTGFKPNSDVDVYLFSTARSLGTVLTDATGAFSGSVAIPMDVPAGRHTLQTNGYSPQSTVRSLSLGVRLNSQFVAPTPELPNTGVNVTGIALAAGSLIVAGGVLALARRRATN